MHSNISSRKCTTFAAPNIYGMLVAHLQQQRKSQQCNGDEAHGNEAATNDNNDDSH